jgi:hypothetical protein
MDRRHTCLFGRLEKPQEIRRWCVAGPARGVVDSCIIDEYRKVGVFDAARE